MTVETESRAAGTLAFGAGAPFVLTPTELQTPTARVALRNVTHVGLIDRPARTPTRRIVQLGALAAGLALGIFALMMEAEIGMAVMLVLLPVLAGVLVSDWAERRFPTPGRYGIEVTWASGVMKIDGMQSEEAAHMLHEQVAAAVRAVQGLNA